MPVQWNARAAQHQSVGAAECRGSGAPECRYGGVPGQWGAGVLGRRSAVVVGCGGDGVPGWRCAGIVKCRGSGVVGCASNGAPERASTGVLQCWSGVFCRGMFHQKQNTYRFPRIVCGGMFAADRFLRIVYTGSCASSPASRCRSGAPFSGRAHFRQSAPRNRRIPGATGHISKVEI